MKRLNIVGLFVLLLACGFLGAPPVLAQGVPGQIFLDLEVPTVRGPGVPPNCSGWHELYPNFCAPHHQDDYDDADGDMMISPCDIITLDGLAFHIVWVGPTYFLTCLDNGEQSGHEPEDPGTGGNPMCQTWHEIFPQFCTPQHVEDWQDNGDGVLSECDIVGFGGRLYHIDRIGLNIIIEPGPSSADAESWGGVKNLYR